MKHALKICAVYAALYILIAFGAIQSQALAQCCWRGGCYSSRCYTAYSYAPRYYSGNYYGQCYGGTCANVQTVAPCQSVENVNPCAHVETVPYKENVQEVANGCACDQCQCEQCDCGETPAACEAVQCTQVGYCASGACPLRKTAQTVTKTAKTVTQTAARSVANALDFVNVARVARGLPALTLDATLEAGAQAHAQSMASYGMLYHNRGYWAENCAQSTGNGIAGAVNQWRASVGHAANMFNPNYTRAGVGVYTDGAGKSWVVLRLR